LIATLFTMAMCAEVAYVGTIRFAAVVKTDAINPVNYWAIKHSGLRLAEISGMQIEDVEMPNHLLKVTGKGNKIRRVPFSEGTADYLRDWVRVRGREPGAFFLLSYHGIRMMLSRVKKESGIDIWTHRFRHTAASKLIQNGADLQEKHQAASPLAIIGLGGKPQRRRFTAA
jgi:integrase